MTIKDLEYKKFKNGNVKVSIQEDATTDANNPKPVVVKNTDSERVPVDTGNSESNPQYVSIVNTDTTVDLEVNVVENITVTEITNPVEIDSTTPIDVDVTNAEFNVNLNDLNGSGRLPVSVDNTPSVNSTIQNSELVTRNQLEYTATDITALGSSTDVTTWTSALADGVLTKEFVDSYQNEFEQITLYTHPDLGDNDKALKKITQYSTQNGATVVESVDYEVVTWDKDASIQGTVSVAASNISPADPNSTIAIHTRVADLTITDDTLGDVTISLSGTNASLYHIHNMTANTFASSMTYIEGNTYQLHTASDFSGASYSHSVTITVTGVEFGVTDSTTIELSGTYTATPSYSNTKYFDGPPNASLDGVYSESSNGGFFGSGSGITATTELRSATRSIAFWFKPDAVTADSQCFLFGDFNGTTRFTGVGYKPTTSGSYPRMLWVNMNDYAGGNPQTNAGILLPSGAIGNWNHICINFNSTSSVNNVTIYLNAVQQSLSYSYNTGNYNTTGYSDYTITKSMIMGPKVYNNAMYPTTMPNIDLGIDEVVCFSPKLDETNNNEITELLTGSSSGTTAQVFDYTTHSRASDIYRYVRFGDGGSDSESSIYCQTTNSTFQLDKTSGLTHTYINNLGSSEYPYVPASGSWSNTYYYSVTQTGNNGYVESETISHDFLSDFSMSFWVKFAGNLNQSYTNAFYFGARRGTNRDWAGRFTGLQIQYRGSSLNYLDVLGTYVQFTDPVMDDGNWHHVVITYDSTGVSGTDTFSATDITNKFTIYVDGSTPTWGTSGGSSIGTASEALTNFRIGDFISSYTEPSFDVDEFAYWTSTKLTSTEVGLIYNSGTVTDLENTSNVTVPTRYWRYEDNNNLTKDTISDSNQGTVDNGTQTAY